MQARAARSRLQTIRIASHRWADSGGWEPAQQESGKQLGRRTRQAMGAASGQTSSGPSSTGPSAPGQAASDLVAARRRIPRYPMAVPVDVTVLRSGLPSSIPGRSLDIGEGGVAAVLAAELQTGDWVAVEFQLPNV